MCRATCGEESCSDSNKRKSEPALVVVAVDQDLDNGGTVKVFAWEPVYCMSFISAPK